MAHHARFSVATGVAVYFCDPHSPWQRCTNENTNGLLRQYLQRGMDFSKLTHRGPNRLQSQRPPSQTSRILKPSERFAELLASTA